MLQALGREKCGATMEREKCGGKMERERRKGFGTVHIPYRSVSKPLHPTSQAMFNEPAHRSRKH
jgi:hypothetical protein